MLSTLTISINSIQAAAKQLYQFTLVQEGNSQHCRKMSTDDINKQTTATVSGANENTILIPGSQVVHVSGESTSFQYVADTQEEEEDVHTCAKCKLLFTNLDTYIEHKMTSKTCGKQFDQNRKNILKRLGPRRGRPPGRKRQYHDSPYNNTAGKKEFTHEDELLTATDLDEKPIKYNRLKLHHKVSDIITDTVPYKCEKCNRQFRREAALNRHKEYDHRVKDSDESDESSDELDKDQVIVMTGTQQSVVITEHLANDICQESSTEQQPEIHYVETLTFDPDTGVYTTSATPAIIETNGTCVIPAAEQVQESVELEEIKTADIQSDNTEVDPDYAIQGKVNYMRSGRKLAMVYKQRAKQNAKTKIMCLKCGKSFANAMSLAVHQVTHSGKRDFKCTFKGCPYAFKTNGSLKRHIRRHTGERPFKCKLCHRAFRESGALTRHRKGRVPCTEKSDSDFPRYKKNLKFTVNVQKDKSEPMIDTHVEQSPAIIPLDENKDGMYQVVHRKVVGVDGTTEIILMSVSGESTVEQQIDGAQSTSTIPDTLEGLQVLQDHAEMDANGQMVMTVSEEDLRAHQGLSLVIEDTVEDDVHYENTDEQYSENSQHDFPDDTLTEHTDEIQEHDLLKREEGELIEVTGQEGELVEVTGQEAMVISQHVNIKMEKIDDNSEPFTCLVDGREFSSSVELITHLKTHLINMNYHCKSCSYSSETGVEMNEHIQLTHLKQWITDVSEAVNTLKPNIQETASVPSKIENTQNIHFLSADNEISQEIIHHGDEVTMATSALETVQKAAELTEQDQIAEQDIHYSEQLTEESDQSQPSHSVTSISLRETGACPFPSDPVPSENSIQTARTALDQLLALYEPAKSPGGSQQPIKAHCPVCGKKFKGHTYLKLHLRIHTGEKAYRCDQCDKSFGTKDALNKHYTTHSLDRNYKCGECGKFFKRISHVREHLKVHTNERPYACKTCFKTFKTVNACKVHYRTHSDDLNFKCEICHKHFREKASLDRHVRTHTGVKPYPCPHCGRKFAEHGTLNRHLRAKVPCTRELQELRINDEVNQFEPKSIINETGTMSMESNNVMKITQISQPMKLEPQAEHLTRKHIKIHILPNGQVNEEPILDCDETTVLTEFSSVVADTQEYIMDSAQQDSTEYVMVTEDQQNVMLQNNINMSQGNMAIVSQDSTSNIPAGNLEIESQAIIDTVSQVNMEIVTPDNLEIISQDDIDGVSQEIVSTQGNSDQQVEYIVMDEGRMDNIIFIDQNTGQQIQLLPSDGQLVMENTEVMGIKVEDESDLPSGVEIIAMETDATELILEEDVVQEHITEEVLQNNEAS